MQRLQWLYQPLVRLSRLPYFDAVVVLVAISVYAFFTFYDITKWSIWFDEGFTAYLVRFNYFDIVRYTASDIHPPLYYWIVKAWTSLWGTSELGFRSLSAIFGMISIGLGFALVRTLFKDRRAALLGVWLMALSPMLIRYGREARAYTLFLMIVLGATYALVRAMQTRRRSWWLTYGALVAVGIMTHYLSIVVWISHWIWRFMILRMDGLSFKQLLRAFFSKEWCMACGLTIVLLLPWLPIMIGQLLGVSHGFWIGPVWVSSFTNLLTNVLFYLQQEQVKAWLAALYFVVLIGVSVCVYVAYKQTPSKQWRKNFLLLGALACGPPILLFILSLPPLPSSFIERYLVPSIASAMLFMAVALVYSAKAYSGKAYKGKHIRRVVPLLVLLLLVGSFTIGIDKVYYYGNYNKNTSTSIRVRELIATMTEKSQPGEPFIAMTPWTFYEASFYTTDEHPIYFLDSDITYNNGLLNMLEQNEQFKIRDVDAFIQRYPIAWYFGESKAGGTIAPPKNTVGWQQIDTAEAYDSIDNVVVYRATRFQTNAR